MSLDQLYLARPLPSLSDYCSPVKGLYLCGSGSHPGLLLNRPWDDVLKMRSFAFLTNKMFFFGRWWGDGLTGLECSTGCHG